MAFISMNPVLNQAALVAELLRFEDPQERLSYIQDRARKAPVLSENFRTENNLIRGCLTKVWLHASYDNGLCEFIVDSESAMVRGLAVLVAQIYSKTKPDEIVAFEAEIFNQAKLDQMITPTRQNGLLQLQKAIQRFATGCL